MQSKLIFPRSIRYLIAVAEHHSFTRAADALHVSQPTLSQQIRLLEETLDVQLLDRSGRNVRLTDAGSVYLHHARRALSELEAGTRAVHEVQDLTRGALRVGITPITEHLTAPLLERFVARYPGIAMNALEMSQDDIETAVLDDQIDVGIVFTDVLATEARSVDIEEHTLFVESIDLAVGRGHALAERHAPLAGADLERQSLILLNTNFALRRHFDLYCIEYGINPRIAIETNSLNMIVQTVGLGHLATVLPRTIAATQADLHWLPLLPELPRHTIALITHRGAYKSAASWAFEELAEEWSNARSPIE